VGLANTITGPYSVISPIILGVMNFYFPFTDEEMHKAETSTQEEKLKAYMNSQAIFYFLITVITTLKCYHFFSAK
jgi:cytochrome c biogenesis protein CcdA